MLVVRFLFGAGEAGAFPTMARAFYSWIPMQERGRVQGINFSGSRLGAAFALPVVAWMITAFGWRATFVFWAVVGFGWAFVWYLWFRNDPADHPRISPAELEHIRQTRQQARDDKSDQPKLSAAVLLRSRNMWLAMVQYFCSNFTFFFALTWLFPHLKKTYQLEPGAGGFLRGRPAAVRSVRQLVCRLAGGSDLQAESMGAVPAGPGDAGLCPRRRRAGRQRLHGPSPDGGHLPLDGDLRRGYDAAAVLGLVHRHRPQALRRRLRHDEHGRQHRLVRHRPGVPLSAETGPARWSRSSSSERA